MHARLGHPGKSRAKMFAAMVDDINAPQEYSFRESCTMGKISKKVERRPLKL